MTALEWLRSKRPIVNDELLAVQAGEYEAVLPASPNRVTALSCDANWFLGVFGPVIEAALEAGRNPIDDLLAIQNDLGWRPVFQLWKVLGL